MTPHTRNPGAEAGAAGFVKAFGGAIDNQQIIRNSHENLAVALIAHRYRLSARLARIVCELALIGGRVQ